MTPSDSSHLLRQGSDVVTIGRPSYGVLSSAVDFNFYGGSASMTANTGAEHIWKFSMFLPLRWQRMHTTPSKIILTNKPLEAAYSSITNVNINNIETTASEQSLVYLHIIKTTQDSDFYDYKLQLGDVTLEGRYNYRGSSTTGVFFASQWISGVVTMFVYLVEQSNSTLYFRLLGSAPLFEWSAGESDASLKLNVRIYNNYHSYQGIVFNISAPLSSVYTHEYYSLLTPYSS